MPKGGRKGLADWIAERGVEEQAAEIALRRGTTNEARAQELTQLLREAGAEDIAVSPQQVQRWIAALPKTAIEPAARADKRIAKQVTRAALGSLVGLQQDLDEVNAALRSLTAPAQPEGEEPEPKADGVIRLVRGDTKGPDVYEYTALVKTRTELRKIIAQLTMTGLKPELVGQYLMTQRDALEGMLSPADFAQVMTRLRTHPDLAPLMALMGWSEPQERAGPVERVVM